MLPHPFSNFIGEKDTFFVCLFGTWIKSYFYLKSAMFKDPMTQLAFFSSIDFKLYPNTEEHSEPMWLLAFVLHKYKHVTAKRQQVAETTQTLQLTRNPRKSQVSQQQGSATFIQGSSVPAHSDTEFGFLGNTPTIMWNLALPISLAHINNTKSQSKWSIKTPPAFTACQLS